MTVHGQDPQTPSRTRSGGSRGGSPLLRWAARRYWPLLLVSLLLVAVSVPWALAPEQDTYRAEALVVAQTSEMEPEALPRYAESVFHSGPVVDRVADVLGVPSDPTELVPDAVSLKAGQDSVVLSVLGQDADPATAATIANAAANAYLLELNKPGPALAVFALQSSASPPLQPVDTGLRDRAGLVLGILGGLALGLGLVLLVLVVRRPALDGAAFEEALAAPLLGHLVMPVPAPPDLDRREVIGLAPLVRHLTQLPVRTLHVVSDPRDAELRVAVRDVLDEVLAGRPAAGLQVVPAPQRSRSAEGAGFEPRLHLVDLDGPMDALAAAPGTPALLVVREGVPEQRLLRTVAQYPDLDVVGVVVVTPRRRRHRAHDAEHSGADEQTATADVDASQPEREDRGVRDAAHVGTAPR